MMELWPFTNFHDLNLDWIIRYMMKFKTDYDEWKSNILEFMNRAESAATSSEQSAEHAEYWADRTNWFYVTPEEYGALGDGTTDDTQALADAVSAADQLNKFVLLRNIYRITGTITVPEGVTIEGVDPEESVINSEVSGVLFDVAGDYTSFKNLTINNLNTISVDSVAINSDASIIQGTTATYRQTHICNCKINNFVKAAVNLSRVWNVVIEKTIIDGYSTSSLYNSRGVLIDRHSDVWSCSGATIRNCYISGCYEGYYGRGAWDVSITDTVFESNEYPANRDERGTPTIFNNCWFEGNNNPCNNGPYVFYGGRNSSGEMGLDDVNLVWSNTSGSIIARPEHVNLDGRTESVLTGRVAELETGHSTHKEGAKLRALGSFGANIVNDPKALSDNYIVAEVDVGTTADGAGGGSSYGDIAFRTGRNATNSGSSVPIRDVVRVRYDGSITPELDGSNQTIGDSTHAWRFLYMKDSQGNVHRLQINTSGQVVIE